MLTITVSWEYGAGTAEGTVAETKTSGELAIETNGKEVKVNASEDNPAVHVARDGNDVVKRESALTKTEGTTENGENGVSEVQDTTADATADVSEENGDRVDVDDAPKDEVVNEDVPLNTDEGSNEMDVSPSAGEDTTTADATKETEDKMDTTPDVGKAEVGEKRSREDDDDGSMHREDEMAEKENGKETKKVKLDNGDAAETVTENGHHTESNGVEETTPKKRKPGRPSKAEAEAKAQAAATEGDASSIAKRTRSKA